RPSLAELPANVPKGTLSPGPPTCGSPQKPDFEEAYSKLAKLHSALKKRHELTQRTARGFRAARDSWMRYAQSLETKIDKLEKKLHRMEGRIEELPPEDSTKLRRPRTIADGALSGQTALDSSSPSDPESDSTVRPRHEAGGVPAGRMEPSSGAELALTGDRSRPVDEETEDGSEGLDQLPPMLPGTGMERAVAIKEEPSSDGPVIVSERTVRKRKHADDDGKVATPPRRIKSEHSNSSDPVITGEAAVFCPHESIDLDEEEQAIRTPRKQHRSDHLQLWEEDEASPVLDKSGSSSQEPQTTRANGNGRPPIRAGWTLDYGVADVAEDAEDTFELFHSPKLGQAEKEPNDQALTHSRLQSLLHMDSPGMAAPFLPATRLFRNSGNSRLDQEDLENIPPPQDPGQRHEASVKPSPVAKASPATAATALRKQTQNKINQLPPRRLRDRPLAELRSEDFKINPKFNNGYKHAFSEVVRGKDERAELAGCTDPNCCGRQFRAIAESELRAGGPGILSRVADIKMMEAYLGNEAYRLVDMTREERQEVWLKAKIQDLADRLGRHRHRFASRPSPPGYWDPDFPSTQELEKNKEEAEKMERRVVEERWREAMRGGGRWLFRDE
ncbi:uncharacterized protein THITE_2038147, partial [Thermothielavioides terrestris NRRL 8126]